MAAAGLGDHRATDQLIDAGQACSAIAEVVVAHPDPGS